jgi:hypothetical protein
MAPRKMKSRKDAERRCFLLHRCGRLHLMAGRALRVKGTPHAIRAVSGLKERARNRCQNRRTVVYTRGAHKAFSAKAAIWADNVFLSRPIWQSGEDEPAQFQLSSDISSRLAGLGFDRVSIPVTSAEPFVNHEICDPLRLFAVVAADRVDR